MNARRHYLYTLIYIILLIAISYFSYHMFRYIAVDSQSGSLKPFIYSLILSGIIYIPLMYFSFSFFTKPQVIKWWTLYCLAVMFFTTCYFVLIKERGDILKTIYYWFGLGIVFYPSKFTYCSFFIILISCLNFSSLPDYSFAKKRTESKKAIYLFFIVAFLAPFIPFALRGAGIKILDKIERPTMEKLMSYCAKEANVKDIKKCLDKKTEEVDKGLTKREKERKAFFSINPSSGFADKIPEETDTFKSLKPCFEDNNCPYVNEKIKSRMKRYKDAYEDVSLIFPSFAGKHKTGLLNFRDEDINPSYRYAKYIRDEVGFSAIDAIIAREKGLYTVFHVKSQSIKIDDKTAFYIVNILKHVEDEDAVFPKNHYHNVEENKWLQEMPDYMEFRHNGGYRLFFKGEMPDAAKGTELFITLDKREDPKEIFIKIGNKILKIENDEMSDF